MQQNKTKEKPRNKEETNKFVQINKEMKLNKRKIIFLSFNKHKQITYI